MEMNNGSENLRSTLTGIVGLGRSSYPNLQDLVEVSTSRDDKAVQKWSQSSVYIGRSLLGHNSAVIVQ